MSRFSTAEQIAQILAHAESGVPPKELCRKFGGLMSSEVRRLKQLEQENRKLKHLVADLALDKQILLDVVSGKA